MGRHSADAIDRWARYVAFREIKPGVRVIVPSDPRLIANPHEREIFSYGRHFPLARFIPARGNVPSLFVLNGDDVRRTWRSSATPDHQEQVRNSVERIIEDGAKRRMRFASIIVPFSAIDGAGIDIDSIRPLHVRDDRRDTFTHRVTISRDVFGEIPARPEHSNADYVPDLNNRVARDENRRVTVEIETRGDPLAMDRAREHEWRTETVNLMRVTLFRGYHYGTGADQWKSGFRDYDPPKVFWYVNGRVASARLADDDNSVTIEWETHRHWLGDSLFTARTETRCPSCRFGMREDGETCARCHGTGNVRSPRYRFLSSFDYNERQPLYFLAALPRSSRAQTIRAAIDDLAPAIVHAAYARDISVKRQGDIFAIETVLSDSEVYAMAKDRTRYTVFTRNARPRRGEIGWREPMTAASIQRMRKETREAMRHALRENLAHATQAESRRILNAGTLYGRDLREARATVARLIARDGEDSYYLKRARERLSEIQRNGRAVYRDRQYNARGTSHADRGKCYCRALNDWRSIVIRVSEKHRPLVPMDRVRQTLAIHGTAHTATEVVVCSRGVTYARGIMRHDPAIAGEGFRARDHANVKLGDSWHLMIRNTVPRQ